MLDFIVMQMKKANREKTYYCHLSSLEDALSDEVALLEGPKKKSKRN